MVRINMWTKSEVEILKMDYLNKCEHYISKIINKSPNAIRIKASRLDISKLAQRERIVLTSVEEQIILGGLLGDFYCEIAKTCKNARLEGGCCNVQEAYFLWKISLLGNLHFSLRRSKTGQLFFGSWSYPCLNYYYHLFYKFGKKKISLEILKSIGALGLAIWYMDDGSYKKRDGTCYLYTNGFTYKENLLIKEWFEMKLNIHPKIYAVKDPKRYPGRVWFYLNFGVNETKKLFEIFRGYIHPSMKYKIGVYE